MSVPPGLCIHLEGCDEVKLDVTEDMGGTNVNMESHDTVQNENSSGLRFLEFHMPTLGMSVLGLLLVMGAAGLLYWLVMKYKSKIKRQHGRRNDGDDERGPQAYAPRVQPFPVYAQPAMMPANFNAAFQGGNGGGNAGANPGMGPGNVHDEAARAAVNAAAVH